jgi:PEP-CTERM motif
MFNSTGETGLATRLDLGPWIAGASPTPAFRINGTSAAIPEPPTLALVGIGLGVLWGYSRFKNRV